jgi:hypothetical protein
MTNKPWTILGNIFKAKERFSYPDDPNISTFLVIKWAVIPYNWDISRGTTYNQVPSSSFAITSMGSSDYINFITKQNYAWQYSELTLTFFRSSLHVSALQFSSLYPQHISEIIIRIMRIDRLVVSNIRQMSTLCWNDDHWWSILA